MKLLRNRFFQAFGIAALVDLVFPVLIYSREYAIQWVEAIVPFSLLFFLISVVMNQKTAKISLEPDQYSDIGSFLQ